MLLPQLVPFNVPTTSKYKAVVEQARDITIESCQLHNIMFDVFQ
jgi:hypothetical protein